MFVGAGRHSLWAADIGDSRNVICVTKYRISVLRPAMMFANEFAELPEFIASSATFAPDQADLPITLFIHWEESDLGVS